MAAKMVTWIWIFGIVFQIVVAQGMEPPGAERGNITSCKEFEQGAHFDPTEIIDAAWKVFYAWEPRPMTEATPVVFTLLSAERLKELKAVVDSIYPSWGIPWSDAELLIELETRPGFQIVLLRQATPGAYRAFNIEDMLRNKARPFLKPDPPEFTIVEVRMKQVGRIIGLMVCVDEKLAAYALARQSDMPITAEDCVERASTLGYRGPGGKLYLQAHRMSQEEL